VGQPFHLCQDSNLDASFQYFKPYFSMKKLVSNLKFSP